MSSPFKKIGSLLASIAPSIATALGGPLAGTAVAALAKAVTGDPAADPVKVESQVLAATDPNVYLQIQKADSEFKLAMEQVGVDLEKIAAADRDSARQREATVKDTTPRNLAYFALGSFWVFSLAGIMIYLKESLDAVKLTAIVGFISTVLGYAISEVKQVFTYYFGSSAGSAAKSEQISDLVGRIEK